MQRYAQSLAACLSAARGIAPRLLVASKGEPISGLCEHLTPPPLQQRIKALWATWAYGELCHKYKGPFLFHGLSNLNLPLKKRNSKHIFFLTIHDGIPLLAPGGVSASIALQSRFLFPRVISLADRIICVSKWTQDWVEQAYPAALGKCVQIPNGFSPWRSPSISAIPASKLRIMVVSRFEKYKQFELLAKIIQKTLGLFLITVVSDGRGISFLRDKIGAHQNIFYFSAIEDIQLQHLYEVADVLLHTSRFEGFCLPAAEALANGVPVVYCKGSGIDEVVGAAVGVGIEPGAPLDTWVSALEAWGVKRRDFSFQQACALYVSNQLQWSQAADLLRQEYQSFAFS